MKSHNIVMDSKKPKKYFKNKLSDKLIEETNKWKNDSQLNIQKKNKKKDKNKINFYFKKK